MRIENQCQTDCMIKPKSIPIRILEGRHAPSPLRDRARPYGRYGPPPREWHAIAVHEEAILAYSRVRAGHVKY
eukprot:4424634-Pyramimonas_sp.AAC.1